MKSLSITVLVFVLLIFTSVNSSANEFGSETCSKAIEFQGKIYFCGKSARLGYELFKSDGTRNGAALFLDINSGSLSSKPSSFFILKNTLYFIAQTNNSGRQIWRTDGTQSGTTQVTNQRFDSTPFSINSSEIMGVDVIYFKNPAGDWWRTDGSSQGTNKLGNLGSVMGTIGDYLYFVKETIAEAPSLFRIAEDALEPELVRVLDFSFAQSCFLTGSGAYADISTNPFLQNKFRNNLYINVICDDTQKDLVIVSDGTASGTRVLFEGIGRLIGDTNLNRYFSLTDFSGQSTIQFTNGSITRALGLCAQTADCRSGNNTGISLLNSGRFIFGLREGRSARPYVWASDGTIQGTQRLMKGRTSTNKQLSTVINNRLVFSLEDESLPHTPQVWQTDGTQVNTQLLQEFKPGVIIGVFSLGRTILVFHSDQATQRTSVWASREFNTPLRLIQGFDNHRLDLQGAVAIEGGLYFKVNGNLWRTDGTRPGTHSLINTITMSPIINLLVDE